MVPPAIAEPTPEMRLEIRGVLTAVNANFRSSMKLDGVFSRFLELAHERWTHFYGHQPSEYELRGFCRHLIDRVIQTEPEYHHMRPPDHLI